MDTIKELFATAPYIAWSLVGVVMAMVVIAANWPKVRWWWHNTWYSFPILGKISRLSKDPNRDPVDRSWFKAEKTLCRDYKQFIRIQDEHDFNEKISYLSKAGDTGRRKMPKSIWPVTIAMVIIEALGFAYVLAGYTLPGASENMQQVGAIGIAFFVSVLLVFSTHFCGIELYKSGKIQGARQEWVEGGRQGKTTTGDVPLATRQSIDDGQPGYVQLMNRVGNKPSYVVAIITVFLVVMVAYLATYVRGQVMEKQLLQRVTGQADNSLSITITAGNDGLNMSTNNAGSGIVLPAADAAANQSAEKKAVQDEVNIDRHGGWGTFIMLAVLFVFLQLLGVYFGYHWSFAGKQSADAYRAIGSGRYASYADVRDHYRKIADTAQSKLEQLQQKIMERNSASGNDGLHTSKTFYDFMAAEHQREMTERQMELERTAHRGQLESKVRSQEIKTAQPLHTALPDSNAETVTTDIASLIKKLNAIGDDKEAKKAFINQLPESTQAALITALKQEKDEAARRAAQRNEELDNLL